MENLINKILEDVDADIKEIMLKDSSAFKRDTGSFYKNWELLANPVATILNWQELRNLKIRE